jgi:hypothetical protein
LRKTGASVGAKGVGEIARRNKAYGSGPSRAPHCCASRRAGRAHWMLTRHKRCRRDCRFQRTGGEDASMAVSREDPSCDGNLAGPGRLGRTISGRSFREELKSPSGKGEPSTCASFGRSDSTRWLGCVRVDGTSGVPFRKVRAPKPQPSCKRPRRDPLRWSVH